MAYNTRTEAQLWLDLLSRIVNTFFYVENSQRPRDGQPDGQICELLPGTDTSAVAEDMVARVGARVGSQEPRGIKYFGLRVHGWVMCEPPEIGDNSYQSVPIKLGFSGDGYGTVKRYIPDVRENHGILRDEVAFTDVVCSRDMRQAHGGDRMHAESLFDNCFDVREIIAVGKRWESARPDDAVDLFLRCALHFGVHSHD